LHVLTEITRAAVDAVSVSGSATQLYMFVSSTCLTLSSLTQTLNNHECKAEEIRYLKPLLTIVLPPRKQNGLNTDAVYV